MSDQTLNELFPGTASVLKTLIWDERQEEAIAACCDVSRRIVAVTGAAGSGKTAIIKEVWKRLTAAGYSVACSAPTGKAAKRISESTGLPAVTNHRLLGYGMPVDHEEEDDKGNKTKIKLSTGPRYGRSKPLTYDTILCDEYAMVNIEIHSNLIAALKGGARLCMFGDTNQLKPIEPNKVDGERPSAFQVALLKFNGIVLNKNHRQDEGSGIAQNAARILQGKIPARTEDFTIKYTDDPVVDCKAYIKECLASGVADFYGVDAQVITQMNKSWVGTKKLNLAIQSQCWNRDDDYMELPRHVWKDAAEPVIRVQVGSKVVYTANTYDLGNEQSVFNGEVGIVGAINPVDGSLDIDFVDRMVTIPPLVINVDPFSGRVTETDPRKNIDLAYVLTTHKMQGSEVGHVVYMMNKSTIYAQSRRNMYTGISRARKHVTLLCDMSSMQKSVKFEG